MTLYPYVVSAASKLACSRPFSSSFSTKMTCLDLPSGRVAVLCCCHAVDIRLVSCMSAQRPSIRSHPVSCVLRPASQGRAASILPKAFFWRLRVFSTKKGTLLLCTPTCLSFSTEATCAVEWWLPWLPLVDAYMSIVNIFIMSGNVLLLHVWMCALKHYVAYRGIPLTLWQWALYFTCHWLASKLCTACRLAA